MEERESPLAMDGFDCRLPKLGPTAAKTFRSLADAIATMFCLVTTFCAGHFSNS
jgi:hypothetical protein